MNEACNKLDHKFDINCGGCCFVASLIAELLEQIEEPYQLFILNDDGYEVDDAYLAIVDHKNEFPCQDYVGRHYWIYLPFYHLSINISGYDNYDECDLVKISGVTSNQLQWLYDTGNWNSFYDISHNNYVKEILNNVFKKYEKEFV